MPRTGRPRKPAEIIRVVGPSIAYVPLTRGHFALIDLEDAVRVEQIKWYATKCNTSGSIYAQARGFGKQTYRLHRFIAGAEIHFPVDHRNRNTLDNRKCNLRKCTHSQNGANAKVRKDSASGFKGVWLNRRLGKYLAYIRKDGVLMHLGYFQTADMAHSVYLAKAVELFGEFARSS